MQRGFSIAKIDWSLLLIMTIIVLMGVFNIYAANYDGSDHFELNFSTEYGKQLIWFVIAFFLGIMGLLIDGELVRKSAFIVYGITLFMLIAVLFTTPINGARSWFGIGSFGIQPSEFAKIGTSMALARFISLPNIRLQDFKTRLYAMGVFGIPAAFILLQPDAGTFVVFTAFLLVLYREGLSGNLLLYGLLCLVLAVITLLMSQTTMRVPLIGSEISGKFGIIGILVILTLIAFIIIRRILKKREQNKYNWILFSALAVCITFVLSVDYLFKDVLSGHQQDRIELFLGLKEDPDGKGYNINRAMAAIGSGGLKGKGYLDATLANASQKHVPMQTTDFIFCTWGEEWGFLGATVLIVLFVTLLLKIIQIAERQRSTFTRVFAYCVACILFYHVMINIGMAIGLAPVIGIPLPFFSYGGSSLMSFTIMIFILARLDAERKDVLR